MTQAQLEKYLWGAAVHLRGHIDAGDYKQYIFPLLFFKRIADVYDEEYAQALQASGDDLDYASFAEQHHFQIPEGAHWRDVRAQTTDVGAALQRAMQQIEQANPDVLAGIFGDANWTNKDRLADATLLNLIEHFSQYTLTLAAVPQDQLGNGYEYLIKKFADDSGHTAAEFYTNRTVVRLMTLLMDPQPGESIYDPTCGSGGLLLNAALQLKTAGQEYRTLRIYGQEINLITSSIARVNMLLHGIEDFQIARGNTLSQPRLLRHDQLRQFDVVLANPPYSIKRWDQRGFAHDPWGRNLWGTPPQGCADYAFQQHIQRSTKPDTGRSVVLHPHGVLFRNQEAHIRRKMLEADVVDTVIGLGPNLFYNSPMESCLLLCRSRKPAERQGRILFINAVGEVKTEKTISHLGEHHIQKILETYRDFQDVEGFAKVVPVADVLANGGNLNISLYAGKTRLPVEAISLYETVQEWNNAATELRLSLTTLLTELQDA
ncbi:MAG: N-6 DNA methylase [Janthinobacterium lividum]